MKKASLAGGWHQFVIEITKYLTTRFPGLNVIDAWGEKSFFYNPDRILKRGVYFVTIKDKDGANDKVSDLSRDGVFRVNFGISKATFISMFGTIPKRPTKGCAIGGPYDFRALNTLTPHPIYGWMAWVSILNPDLDAIKALFDESYKIGVDKYNAKKLTANITQPSS